MRTKEVLTESKFIEDAQELIKTYLVTLKAHQIDEVNVEQIVKELRENGFDVDEKFVKDYLSDTSLVQNIEDDMIKLNVDYEDVDDWAAPDEEEVEDREETRHALNAISQDEKEEKERTSKIAKDREKE